MPSWQQNLQLLSHHPADEFIIQLEVMMVDRPGQPCPPAFLWNGGMVQHVLKSDLALRELEHVQVDSPGLAYLFFYDRHGHRSLMKVAALAMRSHIADAFAEWIGRSAHFDAVPLLLEEGCQCVMAAQERCRQHIQPQEQPTLPIHSTRSASSGSSQLVGGVPPVPEAQEVTVEQETPRVNVARLCRRQTKAQPTPGGGGGGGGSPPSLPECPGGADSDDYSTASESGGGRRHRRCRQAEREDWHQRD